MLDLIENCSNGLQFIVITISNFIKHYGYLPELVNGIRYYFWKISSLFPSEFTFLFVLLLAVLLLKKILKWG